MIQSVLKLKKKRTTHGSSQATGGSIIEQYLIAGRKGSGRAALSQVIQSLRRGLPVSDVNTLSESLEIPADTLAPKLGMSRATLHRRKREGRLSPGESDRVLRFARLMGRA